MSITFFSSSMHEEYQARVLQLKQHVKQLPPTDIDGADRSLVCEMIAAKFAFPEYPKFNTGPIERDEEELSEGNPWAYINVYFQYVGDPQLFRLYQSSSPMPPPQFDVVDGRLKKRYKVEKRRIESIEEEVQRDIDTINRYMPEVQKVLPNCNRQLREHAEAEFDRRMREINENKHASAKLVQSKLTLRKRDVAVQQLIVPLERKKVAGNRA